MIINYYDTSLVKACEQRLIVQTLEVELLKIYDHVIVQLPTYSIQGEMLTQLLNGLSSTMCFSH